jgi:hypothetical protein
MNLPFVGGGSPEMIKAKNLAAGAVFADGFVD